MSILDLITEKILANRFNSYHTEIVEYSVIDLQETEKMIREITKHFGIREFDIKEYGDNIGFQIVHVYATKYLTIVIEFFWDNKFSEELQKQVSEICRSLCSTKSLQLCGDKNEKRKESS